MSHSWEREAAIIESILFLENDALGVSELARKSSLDKIAVEKALQFLEEHYDGAEHGIFLEHVGGNFQLSPKKELQPILKINYGRRNDDKLSKAAMETLSIIAYSQPITRAEIDNLRGVASDRLIRQLVKKKMIMEMGKKDIPGKPLLYGTTKEFLKVFRLASIADLPKLEETEKDRFELNG